jgi:hypothetical protein
MKSKLITIALVGIAASIWVCTAFAQCPATVTATIPPALNNFGSPVKMLLCPAGDGDSLGLLNAAIKIQLSDGSSPIPNYPWNDIWMEVPGLCSCYGGNRFYADFNTDANGETEFSSPFHGGGSAVNPVFTIWLPGAITACYTSPTLSLLIRSFDQNCDGRVDELDEAIMQATPIAGDFSRDLDFSGNEDPGLAESLIMQPHFASRHECP